MPITQTRIHDKRGYIWLLAIVSALCLSLFCAGAVMAQVPEDDKCAPGELPTPENPCVLDEEVPEEVPPGTPEEVPPGTPEEVPPGTPEEVPPGTPEEVPPGTPEEVPPGTPEEVPPGTPEEVPPGTTEEVPPVTETPTTPSVPTAPTTPSTPVPTTPEDTPTTPSQPQAPPLAVEEDRNSVAGDQQSGSVSDEQTTVVAGQTGVSAATLPFTGAAESPILLLLLGLTGLGLGFGLRRAVELRP